MEAIINLLLLLFTLFLILINLDHVHLLVSYKPSISVSNLIANLKATSSKTMWRNHADYLKQQYHKRVLWTGSYFVASCGGVTLEKLRQYVEQQDRPSDQ